MTSAPALTMLHKMPLDTLKIDQGFVRTMLESDAQIDVVDAIIALAQKLGLEVIAEGIEEEAIGTRLIEMGSDKGQGFGIARPMPAADIPAWKARWQPPKSWRC